MNLREFVDKYNGKFVEYHSYGTGALNQCVDVCNQYIVEVLGLTAIIGTNAQDFPSKANPADYDYIVNTPLGVPEAGDLVIFKSTDNVGHISIFLEGNANLFTSFDQNYPTGSPCQKVSHNYRNVLGWLHPKQKPMSNALQECLAQHTLLVNKCNEKDKTIETLNGEKKAMEDLLTKRNLEIENINKQYQDLVKEHKEVVENLTLQIKGLKETNKTLDDELSSFYELLRPYYPEKKSFVDRLSSLIKDYNTPKDPESLILTKIADWIKKILGKLK